MRMFTAKLSVLKNNLFLYNNTYTKKTFKLGRAGLKSLGTHWDWDTQKGFGWTRNYKKSFLSVSVKTPPTKNLNIYVMATSESL